MGNIIVWSNFRLLTPKFSHHIYIYIYHQCYDSLQLIRAVLSKFSTMYESSAWIDGQMLFCCSKYYWEQDTHATVGDDFQQSDSHFAASYMIRVKRNRFSRKGFLFTNTSMRKMILTGVYILGAVSFLKIIIRLVQTSCSSFWVGCTVIVPFTQRTPQDVSLWFSFKQE